jgi:hypothetical protein
MEEGRMSEIDGKLDTVKAQLHAQFGEVMDSGLGSLKTTIAGLVGAVTMVKNDLLLDNFMWENWVVGGAILVIGLYSRSK